MKCFQLIKINKLFMHLSVKNAKINIVDKYRENPGLKRLGFLFYSVGKG